MGNRKRRQRTIKQLVFIGAVLAAGAFGYYWYANKLATRDRVSGQFVTESGKELCAPFSFEVANTNQLRQKGLMYRKKGDMREDEGMIFAFAHPKHQSFWMRNTYLSLDMLFLAPDFKVMGLLENVPVLNEEPRSVEGESQYVVELLAGTAKRCAITSGARLKLERSVSAQD